MTATWPWPSITDQNGYLTGHMAVCLEASAVGESQYENEGQVWQVCVVPHHFSMCRSDWSIASSMGSRDRAGLYWAQPQLSSCTLQEEVGELWLEHRQWGLSSRTTWQLKPVSLDYLSTKQTILGETRKERDGEGERQGRRETGRRKRRGEGEKGAR